MKITVIIVSYNTRKLLTDCLDSLLDKNKGVDFEIIVVDNASADGSASEIKKHFKNIILLENSQNLGFSKANNQAIKIAKGEYILLLNSDTLFLNNSLNSMVDYMEKNPKTGIATCQLVDSELQVTDTGGYFPTFFRVLSWMFFLDDLPFVERFIKPFHPLSSKSPSANYKKESYEKNIIREWVSGAFFFVRREVINQIGLLDENMFMYAEEMEYCYRATGKNWKIGLNPEVKVVHLGGKSGNQKNAIIGEYRGIIYFYKKHKNKLELFIVKLLLRIGALLRIVLFGIIKHNPEARNNYAEAYRIV